MWQVLTFSDWIKKELVTHSVILCSFVLTVVLLEKVLQFLPALHVKFAKAIDQRVRVNQLSYLQKLSHTHSFLIIKKALLN